MNTSENLRLARRDWLAALILRALRTQERRTMRGASGDLGALALVTAAHVRAAGRGVAL